MIISAEFPFTFQGRPATMRVLRNDGYCWGRLIPSDGPPLDVSTSADHYEDADEVAAEAFIRKARALPAMLDPAMGWTTGEPTHALTILQPWAWAIAAGLKTVENRTWKSSFRGPIYIHAGAKRPKAEDLEGCARRLAAAGSDVALPPIEDFAYGALVATAEIVRCGHFPQDPWTAEGCYQFKFANVRKLATPIPIRGALGFWPVRIKS